MCTRLGKSKCATKVTETAKNDDHKMNIFSMIKFYESIPDYDTIRHLSCYDFLERLNAMKTVHSKLTDRMDPTIYEKTHGLHRPRSGSAKSRRKLRRSRRCNSASAKQSTIVGTATQRRLDTLKQRRSINVPNCTMKRSSTSNSSNITNLSKSCTSIRDKLSMVADHGERHSAQITPSPVIRTPTFRPSPMHDHMHHLHSQLHHDAYDSRVTDEMVRDYLHYRHLHHLDRNNDDPLGFHYHHHHHHSLQNNERPINHNKSNNHEHTSRPTSSPHAKSIQLGDAQPTVPICLGKSKRAKSCPKDWISNYFVPPESNSPTTVDIQKQDCVRLGSASTQRPESSKTGDTRDTKCRKRSAGKAKVANHVRPSPPSSANECHAQIVRTNLAANLRHQWSRQKLMQMSNEKINSIATVIPRCHRWNVRKSPAWQSFNLEDTTTEKFIREMTRKEEQKMRQHAHLVHMSRMRQRVKSAQLLLEGRALAAKEH